MSLLHESTNLLPRWCISLQRLTGEARTAKGAGQGEAHAAGLETAGNFESNSIGHLPCHLRPGNKCIRLQGAKAPCDTPGIGMSDIPLLQHLTVPGSQILTCSGVAKNSIPHEEWPDKPAANLTYAASLKSRGDAFCRVSPSTFEVFTWPLADQLVIQPLGCVGSR